MNGFLLRSFGVVLSVLCLSVASLNAQGALAGLGTDVVPEDLAHLPGDTGIGTSGILIRRGTGIAPLPSSQPAKSALSAFIASTSKGVSVRNLPSLTTVITLPPARVRRPNRY